MEDIEIWILNNSYIKNSYKYITGEYKNFSPEEIVTLDLDDDYCSENDLVKLIDFWILPKISFPIEFYIKLIAIDSKQKKNKESENKKSENEESDTDESDTKYIRLYFEDFYNNKIGFAVDSDNFELFMYLLDNNLSTIKDTLKYIVSVDNLFYFKYLLNQYNIKESLIKKLSSIAIDEFSLNIIKYYIENLLEFININNLLNSINYRHEIEILDFLRLKNISINNEHIRENLGKFGSIELIEYFMSINVNLDFDKILIHACEYGFYEIIEFLYKINKINFKCLLRAAETFCGNDSKLHIIKFLMEKNPSYNEELLRILVMKKRFEICDELLSSGINISCCEIVTEKLFAQIFYETTYERGDYYGCRDICESETDRNNESDLKILKYLLNKGLNINCCNCILIKNACKNNFYDIIEFLINNGALFHGSILYKNIIDDEILKLLLEKNVYKDEELLMYACKSGNINIIKILIDKGVNIKNNNELLVWCNRNNILQEILDYKK